jgi:hypothetical protein
MRLVTKLLVSFVGLGVLLASVVYVSGQSSPGLIFGQIPTAAQWNSYFANKLDYNGYTPLNPAGGTMTGPLTTAPSTTGAAGFNIPAGTAPTSPNNGDIWNTGTLLGSRINGTTVGLWPWECSWDNTPLLACVTATTARPQIVYENTTADASNPTILLAKSRAVGNTLTSDLLGAITGYGYANSAYQAATNIQFAQAASSSGSNIPTKTILYTSNAAGLLNQSLTFDNLAHVGVTPSAAPTVQGASCGTTPGSPAGGDFSGRVTEGTTATGCIINFAGTYANAPYCIAQLGTANAVGVTTSTTQLTVVHSSLSSQVLTWICTGN